MPRLRALLARETTVSGRRASTGPLTPAMHYAYTGPQFAVEGRAFVQVYRPFDPAPGRPEDEPPPFSAEQQYEFRYPDAGFAGGPIQVDRS